MNFDEHVNSKANDYKQCLLSDVKTSAEFTNVVNSIFFPLDFDIEEWLEWTEVKSFHEYRFKGHGYINKIFTRNDLDNIPSLGISNSLSPYTIFSYLKYDTYEDAIKRFPTFYHLVQKDFDRRIDEFIFNRLIEYKPRARNTHLYSKSVSKSVDLILDTHREHLELEGIIGYTLPTLSVNIHGERSLNFGTIDVRNLLFLPASSFSFFYTDSHDFTINRDSHAIQNVTRKKDEPVIYYLDDEQKYMITNSWKNIDRYNRYIQIILELSLHYFEIFERWLTKTLDEKHLKPL